MHAQPAEPRSQGGDLGGAEEEEERIFSGNNQGGGEKRSVRGRNAEKNCNIIFYEQPEPRSQDP